MAAARRSATKDGRRLTSVPSGPTPTTTRGPSPPSWARRFRRGSRATRRRAACCSWTARRARAPGDVVVGLRDDLALRVALDALHGMDHERPDLHDVAGLDARRHSDADLAEVRHAA